ncbi:MAG: hypothetical protein HYT22_00090 [Candidatus Niyogibacteria bacterium]|nr:hypothetical protein [Candidatus Niyogibacteria bacterium]
MKRIAILVSAFAVALSLAIVQGPAMAEGGRDPGLALAAAKANLDSAYALLSSGIDLLNSGPGQEGHARLVLQKVVEKTEKAKKILEPWLEDGRAPVRSLALWYMGNAERFEILSTLRLVGPDGNVKGRPTADVSAELKGLGERYSKALDAMETPESKKFFTTDQDPTRGTMEEYAETLRKLLMGARQAEKDAKEKQNERGQNMNEKGEGELMAALGKDLASEQGKALPQLVPIPAEGEPQEGYTPGIPPDRH